MLYNDVKHVNVGNRIEVYSTWKFENFNFQYLFLNWNNSVRDWSLITGRGGLQNGRGGHMKFYPYEKGGAEKVLAVLKGGHKKFGGRFYAIA